SADSRLIHAVTGTNAVAVMPPMGPRLPDAKVAVLKAWIDQGCKGVGGGSDEPVRVVTDHWSFKPPVRLALPAVKNKAWVRNAIDNFILARLEKEGLSPSPEAGRAT